VQTEHEQGAREQATKEAESVDQVLAEKRKELDHALAQASKTESKKAKADEQYQAKISHSVSSGTCGDVNQTSGAGPGGTFDVVASIIAANRKRAAEAHMPSRWGLRQTIQSSLS
jgi:hypothetical protein